MADDSFNHTAIARRALLFILACGSPALAQKAEPGGMSLAQAAARRFPQPVRVGDLIGRTVLQPVESQPILGRVRDVVALTNGAIQIVMDEGGVFGFFARPVGVPVEAMALLGEHLVLVEFTPKQLAALNDFDRRGTTSLRPDATISVALARPPH